MMEVCGSLYRHRELIGVLVARQLKLRYRGSVLGFTWTLINPLVLMLVYTLVFSFYLRVDVEKYPAFLFTGLLPWIWFASSLQQGVTSILDGAGLVTKSQFPAEALPVAALTANTVNFLLMLPLLLLFLLVFRVKLGLPVLLVPVLVGVEYVFCFGLVLLVAALNVHFRDLQHILVHLLTVLQFVTPVFYSLSLIPEPFRSVAAWNPLAVLIGAFQDVLYYGRLPDAMPLLLLLALSGVILVLGARYFSRHKATFAESL
jgi:ABC-type polysaccharide/polyol phosphate export permease